MVKVKPPRWPVPQLVTFELRDYRQRLEQALAGLPEQSADREVIQQRLAEVIGEQDERARARQRPPRPDHPDKLPSPDARAGTRTST